jgi:hypothetical protein
VEHSTLGERFDQNCGTRLIFVSHSSEIEEKDLIDNVAKVAQKILRASAHM